MATVIGDVVGSRRADDRGAMHAALRRAIDRVNASGRTLSPLHITLGDEFQGIFADVPTAVAAMVALRLELLEDTDTRYGLGWGPVQNLEPSGAVQDGPGWWAARAAIEASAAAALRRRSGTVRAGFSDVAQPGGTPYVDAGGTPLSGLVTASLRTLDELFAALSDLDVRLIRGTADGLTQTQLAAAEGITQSAVSQRLARNGAWSLLAAYESLGGPLGTRSSVVDPSAAAPRAPE